MSWTIEKYLPRFLAREDISQVNKDTIEWFLDRCASEGLSEARQCKYIQGFGIIFKKFADPDFILNNASEEQLRRLVADIHRSDYAESVKRFYKVCLKKFYRVKHGGRFPRKVDFIKTTQGKETSVTKEDLYLPEEIQKIVGKLRNIRDQAYIMVQYESAGRTGEILNARLGDVRFDDGGDFIHLRSLKGTPDRDIQLVEAGFYLKQWIRLHPLGSDPFNVKDPNAPLFVKLEQFKCKYCGQPKTRHKNVDCPIFTPREDEPMILVNILKSFKTACLKAGIRKRSYRLYNLRHTRITEVAKFLSHEQLCKFAGWKPGSGQFHVYVHLNSEDVNQAIR